MNNSSDLNFNRKAVCKHCTEEIFANGNALIRCEECPDLDLCPECFAHKAELGDHKPSHAYRILDNAEYQVLGSSWTAGDHVKLLNAIEQYGYGNWEDVSRFVSSRGGSPVTKCPEETKREFCVTFVDGPAGKRTWNEETRGKARDHTRSNPLLPPAVPNEPPSNLTVHESIMLGYMPKRDDFEIEYDNVAERLVSQIQDGGMASTEDDEIEMALKIAHVDMYKFKLRERETRQRVAREHGLIRNFFKENPYDLTTKKDKPGNSSSVKCRKSKNGDFYDRLKILAEFQGAKEHPLFIASLNRERELKQQIKDFHRYRKNGITKLTDSTEFEIQKSRQNRKRLEQRKKNGEADLKINVKNEETNGNASASSNKEGQEYKAICLNELPGYDILSFNEKKLCSNLKLTPAQYISYKTSLLTHHLQKKKGQSPKPLNPIGLDKNNRKIIFNFLMRAGWINAY